VSELRLSRGEYWLLESAVEGMPPLRWLVAPQLEQIFNKTGHRLGRGALVDTMERLVVADLLCAHRANGGNFAPTRAEIEAALDESPDPPRAVETHYGLTAAGGAAWESFAAPDWNRYIDSGCDEQHRYDATCADRKRLLRYLAALRREGTFQEESLVWDEVAPWQATYWKQLPRGHRVRFVCIDARLPDPPSSWYCRWYQWG
jgi:hypothetical protein